MIRAIRLRNWGPYRGDHELLIHPKAYGVFARDERDDERSNWCGKSMLLEAVDFALFGRVNPDRHFGKEDWITEGEPDGHVDVVLAGDVVVHRARKRGKPEAFTVTGKGISDSKDAAELTVRRLVGLTDDGFLTAAYFRQRQMAQLVLMRPGPRMDVVSGWFGLEPLEKGEVFEREKFRGLAEEGAKLESRALALESEAEGLKQGCGSHVDLPPLEAVVEEARQKCEEAHRQRGLRASSEDFVEAQREGKALAAKLKEGTTAALLDQEVTANEQIQSEMLLALGPLRKEVEQKRMLARGQFGGVCPIASAPCPAKDWVVGERTNAGTLGDELVARYDQQNVAYGKLVEQTRHLRYQLEARRRDEQRIVELRARCTRLFGAHVQAEALGIGADVEHLFAALKEAQERLANARALQEQGRQALEQANRKLAGAKEAREGRIELTKHARVRHAAASVFGAARRRIGEGALTEIETGANEVLGECGVDLRVAVSWSREGGDLAKSCQECGAAMPASAKVKDCSTCGAERGKNIINELRLQLSSHSGAAEDLAGLALQLSAGDWIRQRRGSMWACGLIDEPFGQLDSANRKKVASHLARVLAGARGFQQALVVAHQQQVLEALPGRIEIIRRGKFSEVKVVT